MVSRAWLRAARVSAVKRIGIVAALPGELRPLVKGGTRISAGKNIHHWERDSVQKDGSAVRWIAVCAGIGRDAATRAFAAAEKAAPLDAVLSIGWAGSLRAEIAPGAALSASWIIDAKTGERFELAAEKGCGLITAARIADAAEKHRLAAAYPGANIVDMEAATIARLASMRGIPAYCFKGVSDAVDDRLPDLNPYVDASGQFHTVRFVAGIALRPHYWSVLRSFGANSNKAAVLLARDVRKFLKDEAYLREYR